MALAPAEEGAGSACFVAIQSHAADNSWRRTQKRRWRHLPQQRSHAEERAQARVSKHGQQIAAILQDGRFAASSG
jgi:hypothetical protein